MSLVYICSYSQFPPLTPGNQWLTFCQCIFPCWGSSCKRNHTLCGPSLGLSVTQHNVFKVCVCLCVCVSVCVYVCVYIHISPYCSMNQHLFQLCAHLWGGFFDAPARGLPPQGPGACMPSLQRGPLVSAPSCSGPGICPSSWKMSIWRADTHWGRACSEALSAVWTPAWKRCIWGNSCYCVSKSGLGSILTFHSKQDSLTPHSSA